jgi:hypothetical protein
MSLFQRLFSRKPEYPLAPIPSETLLDSVIELTQKCIKGYPRDKPEGAIWLQGEWACVFYTWMQQWHDSKATFGTQSFTQILDLLHNMADDHAPAFRLMRAMHSMHGPSPEEIIRDRIRLYRSAILQNTTPGCPPPIMTACAMLGVLSARKHKLLPLPQLKDYDDLLGYMIGEQIMPDALQVFSLTTHSQAVLQHLFPLWDEAMTELYRRKQNNKS